MHAQDADHILIPLLDSDFTLAQIAQAPKDGDTRAVLYLTGRHMTLKSEVFAIPPRDVKAMLAVDLALVPHNHWEIIGYEPIPSLPRALTLTDDTPLRDPSVIEAFANAIHGLYPWDGFPDAALFTNMLRTPSVLPTHARMTANFPKTESP
jgi:hypothetical protein